MSTFIKSTRSSMVDNIDFRQSSERLVAEVLESKESLQKDHREFKSLTGFTANLIHSNTLRKSSVQELTSKVLPDDIFCLIGIPVIGKFGAFYQGFDKQTWAKLTLKIFKPRIFVNGGSCKEKQILSLTKKPDAIPRIIAAFRFELQNCLVLEYMTPYSLQDKLRFCRRFPPNVVLFFMCDMVMVIAFLHSKGLIHRNITLDVFWIQENGHLKLIDYTKCVKSNTMFRKSSKNWNTLDYLPPEVFSFSRCTKVVDMWALGVILFKMTTGRQPFYADTQQRLIRTIKEKYPVYNSLFNEVSGDLCKQLLQKDPKHRLGYNSDTFLCISSHPYFNKVPWDRVLSGASKAPEIPLLMSAVRQAKYNVRPLDFRAKANQPTILKKKPLLLQEICTKSVAEMFNEKVLDKNHALNIAKYKNEKSVMHLPRHKRLDRFSFQKMSQESSPRFGFSGERGYSDSPSTKTLYVSSNESTIALTSNLRHRADYLLCFMYLRLSLEQIFADVLDEFEEKVKQDTSAIEALEELRDTVNKKIDEIKAATISATIMHSIPMIMAPTMTRAKTI